MVVVDVEDVVVTGKFTASIYLAVVLIRFTVAPVKSLPDVTVFTFNNIAVIAVSYTHLTLPTKRIV